MSPIIPEARRYGAIVLAAGIAAAVAGPACHRTDRAPTPAAAALHVPDRTPIVLVTIDTLRADRLGAYGSRAGLTPTLDALATAGTVFMAAVSQVPLTLPSHATLMTGLRPPSHGVRTNDGFHLASDRPTLAGVLRARGYETAAFIGGYPLASSGGLSSGFDQYDDRFLQDGAVERPADAVVDAAIEWLTSRPKGGSASERPYFVWLHFFDPHSPYSPPPSWQRRGAAGASSSSAAAYDEEVAYADAALGRFLRELEARRELDAALVVVAADHGEGLDEHGERTHGMFVYDTTVRVPLVVRLPAALAAPESQRVTAPVELTDVAPTIAGLAGATWPAPVEGLDLRPLLAGGQGDLERAVYAESYYQNVLLGWSPLRAARTASWKYIEAPTAELYDLEGDPGERRNLASTRSALARGLAAALPAARRAEPVGTEPSAEAAERLRSLGYASGRTSSAPGSRLVDPKDRVDEWRLVEQGIDAVRLRPEEARAAFARVLALDPENGLASKSLGDLALARGDSGEALTHYRNAIRAGFVHADVFAALGGLARRLGRLDEAAVALGEATVRNATDAAAWNQLGIVEAARGREAEAREAFRRASAADPTGAEPRYNLALLDVRAHHLAEAEAGLRQAVLLKPDYAQAWYELGTLLLAGQRTRDACDAYREALRIDPDYPEALFGAARAEALIGDVDGARRDYRRFIQVAPQDYAPQVAAARGALARLR
ncbi:MAG: sulfatase-like hydrolase/transferase [Vicinamibacterales bacterium]